MSNPLHPAARVASLDTPAGVASIELRKPLVFLTPAHLAAFIAQLDGAGADVTALIAAVHEMESHLRTESSGENILVAADARSLDIDPTATGTSLVLPEIADAPGGVQVAPGRVFDITHIGAAQSIVVANSHGVALAELFPGDRITCIAATPAQVWTLSHDPDNQPFTRSFFVDLATAATTPLWTPRFDTMITRAWLRIAALANLTDPTLAIGGIASGPHMLCALPSLSGVNAVGQVVSMPAPAIGHVAAAGQLIEFFQDDAAAADLMLCELIVEAVHL